MTLTIAFRPHAWTPSRLSELAPHFIISREFSPYTIHPPHTSSSSSLPLPLPLPPLHAHTHQERSRQKSIISLVNQQKGAIDGTLSLLKDLDNHNDASLSLDEKEVQRARLQGQLDEAKLTYRAGYMELQLCKRQLAEATALKKRALSGLVGAFDRLSAANRVPLPGVTPFLKFPLPPLLSPLSLSLLWSLFWNYSVG